MPENFTDDERFDGLYLNVASQTRGIDPLLDTVFSFLRRKTDFFAGPPGSDNGTDIAVAKVQEVCRKHAALYQQAQQKKKPKLAAKTPKKEAKKADPDVIEMGQDGAFDVSSASAVKSPLKDEAPKVSAKPVVAETPKEDAKAKDDDEPEPADKDDQGPPPVGNGGTVDGKYTWTQMLSELNVVVPVPDGTRGKDLDVTISRTHLKVGLRSQPGVYIVDAPFTKTVIVDDSFWTVEDGNRLVMNLQKQNQMEWWDSVCVSDPKINVRAIQPENSSLADLDGDTRKTVEKMMYDQRQKALGRPSSDEETKLNALEQFKKQHPELDFSNAKIS